jgi:hypothetical protein
MFPSPFPDPKFGELAKGFMGDDDDDDIDVFPSVSYIKVEMFT